MCTFSPFFCSRQKSHTIWCNYITPMGTLLRTSLASKDRHNPPKQQWQVIRLGNKNLPQYGTHCCCRAGAGPWLENGLFLLQTLLQLLNGQCHKIHMNYCLLASLVFSSANFYYTVQHRREIVGRLPSCTVHPLIPICTKAAGWPYPDSDPRAFCHFKNTAMPQVTHWGQWWYQRAVTAVLTWAPLYIYILRDLEAKWGHWEHYRDVIGLSVHSLEICTCI